MNIKDKVNNNTIHNVSKQNKKLINYCDCKQPTEHNWDYDLQEWKCEKCGKIINFQLSIEHR